MRVDDGSLSRSALPSRLTSGNSDARTTSVCAFACSTLATATARLKFLAFASTIRSLSSGLLNSVHQPALGHTPASLEIGPVKAAGISGPLRAWGTGVEQPSTAADRATTEAVWSRYFIRSTRLALGKS